MSNRKIWNIYKDKNIRAEKTIFNVYYTEDIEEFWLFFQEYSIIKNEEVTHLIVKYLFEYTEGFLKKVESFDVIIEYAENIQYITFWHQGFSEILQKTYIELKNYDYFNLQINDEKATFQIKRTSEICPDVEVKSVASNNIFKAETTKNTHIYNFISKDDLITMQEINDELLNQMFYISSAQVDEDKLNSIVEELDGYIAIFDKHAELSEIRSIVLGFRDVIEENMAAIIENSNADLNTLFEGIITNLKTWTNMSFIKGIEDINYYNASLSSDISMIGQFLNMNEEEHFDDDIFF